MSYSTTEATDKINVQQVVPSSVLMKFFNTVKKLCPQYVQFMMTSAPGQADCPLDGTTC